MINDQESLEFKVASFSSPLRVSSPDACLLVSTASELLCDLGLINGLH